MKQQKWGKKEKKRKSLDSRSQGKASKSQETKNHEYSSKTWRISPETSHSIKSLIYTHEYFYTSCSISMIIQVQIDNWVSNQKIQMIKPISPHKPLTIVRIFINTCDAGNSECQINPQKLSTWTLRPEVSFIYVPTQTLIVVVGV